VFILVGIPQAKITSFRVMPIRTGSLLTTDFVFELLGVPLTSESNSMTSLLVFAAQGLS
jgi:hypothetical protein